MWGSGLKEIFGTDQYLTYYSIHSVEDWQWSQQELLQVDQVLLAQEALLDTLLFRYFPAAAAVGLGGGFGPNLLMWDLRRNRWNKKIHNNNNNIHGFGEADVTDLFNVQITKKKIIIIIISWKRKTQKYVLDICAGIFP